MCVPLFLLFLLSVYKPRNFKAMSEKVLYRAEVAGVGENVWSGNAVQHESIESAQKYLSNLATRWFGFDMSRVVPVNTPLRETVNKEDKNIYQNFRR